MSGAGRRTVWVIGIGAGSPDHVTQQAIAAMNEVDVFLVADKGDATDELVALRHAICHRFIDAGRSYQLVTVPDPERQPQDGSGATAYERSVADWHAARVHAYAQILDGLPEDAVIGFLVWGDPAFYDSTIRIVDALPARSSLDVRVVPGISAFQALAAAHGVVLHAVGRPVHVTTGRRLVAEWRPDLGTVVVMLDGALACRALVDVAPDLVIRWGAYVGMPQQELRSGRLADVVDDLVALRASLRERHGWIMDVYTLSAG
ncbi:precorrin-6A synthase (deacetylating) [Pedococcus sp. NPDC057267]|uniref:precorrin-6A synthase (deacetylating) n=1 Tax=Pedococcus sp. NPDC057267 TaxID=3346077 RepID=UPI00362BDE89